MHRTKDSINNPIFRFVLREVTVASKLLDTVRNDLRLVREMCADGKSTNMLRQLAKDLHGDLIPARWRKFIIANITATEWINDFNNRINQLQKLSTSTDLGKSGLWFGGMLFPEAYLTATRQKIAQENSWSLEELSLKFELDPNAEAQANNAQGFIVDGLSIEGAEYSQEEKRIVLTESLSSKLPKCNLKWIHKNQEDSERIEGMEYI